jgi:hypothetical protein
MVANRWAAIVDAGCSTNASLTAGRGVTTNAPLVALANPGVVATSVYPDPGSETVRSLNVARPPTADRVAVPPSIDPVTDEDSATVISPEKFVTNSPWASRAATPTPVSASPATAPAGVVTKARWGPVIANATLVADCNPDAVATSWNPVPGRSTVTEGKEATPDTAAAGDAPTI